MGADCSILFDNSTSTEKSYEVLMTEPSFEVRKYSTTVIAEINVEVIGVDAGIATLNKYFGEEGSCNDSTMKKLPKITPTITSMQLIPSISDIDKSNPSVLYNSKAIKVIYLLSEEYRDVESVPTPVDRSIDLKLLPSRMVAVRKFTEDKSSNKQIAEKASLLFESMLNKRLYPRKFDSKKMFFEFAENEIWVPLNEDDDGIIFEFGAHIPQKDYSKIGFCHPAGPKEEEEEEDDDGVEYLYYYETEEERLACMQQQKQIVQRRIPILLNKSNDEDL